MHHYGTSSKELTGLRSQELRAHEGSIWTMKLSPDGCEDARSRATSHQVASRQLILSVSASASMDKTVPGTWTPARACLKLFAHDDYGEIPPVPRRRVLFTRSRCHITT